MLLEHPRTLRSSSLADRGNTIYDATLKVPKVNDISLTFKFLNRYRVKGAGTKYNHDKYNK